MSTGLAANPSQENLADISVKLNFSKNLQAVTNKIHATNNIDEIMLEVSKDICSLFDADRLTIYSISEDKTSIVSKVKTGLNSFKDLKLPIAEQSLAVSVNLQQHGQVLFGASEPQSRRLTRLELVGRFACLRSQNMPADGRGRQGFFVQIIATEIFLHLDHRTRAARWPRGRRRP